MGSLQVSVVHSNAIRWRFASPTFRSVVRVPATRPNVEGSYTFNRLFESRFSPPANVFPEEPIRLQGSSSQKVAGLGAQIATSSATRLPISTSLGEPLSRLSRRSVVSARISHLDRPVGSKDAGKTNHVSRGQAGLDQLNQPSLAQKQRDSTAERTSQSSCHLMTVEGDSSGAGLQSLLRPLLCSALVVLTSASSLVGLSPQALAATDFVFNDLSGAIPAVTRSAGHNFPLCPLGFVQYGSVSDVPNPRTYGVWTVDDAGVMSDSQRAHIDQVAQKMKEESGAEIVVVTVDELSGRSTPKTFATRLFNDQWGVGDRQKNNGVLLLLVKNPRRLEIEIGRGLNQPFNTASWLKQMQKQKMVPLLKMNDFGGGLVAGVDALADKLRAIDADVQIETEPIEAVPADGIPRIPMNDTLALAGLYFGPIFVVLWYAKKREREEREREEREKEWRELDSRLGSLRRKRSGAIGRSRSTRSSSYTGLTYDSDDDDIEYFVGSSYLSDSSYTRSNDSRGSSSLSSSGSSAFGGGSSYTNSKDVRKSSSSSDSGSYGSSDGSSYTSSKDVRKSSSSSDSGSYGSSGGSSYTSSNDSRSSSSSDSGSYDYGGGSSYTSSNDSSSSSYSDSGSSDFDGGSSDGGGCGSDF